MALVSAVALPPLKGLALKSFIRAQLTSRPKVRLVVSSASGITSGSALLIFAISAVSWSRVFGGVLGSSPALVMTSRSYQKPSGATVQGAISRWPPNCPSAFSPGSSESR